MDNQDSTYNGWRNYQTWDVALWLSSDYEFDTAIREYINELGSSDNLVLDLAQYLEDFVEELTPDLGASTYSDLLNNAIAQVDFYEIAENYLTA